MSIILHPRKLIAIPVSYFEIVDKGVTKQYFTSKHAPKNHKVYTIVGHWKLITWEEQSIIFANSLKDKQIDPILYRDQKLKKCLKRIVDTDGTAIDVSDEVINNLGAELASELLSSFETITEPSENDFKRLTSVSNAFFKGQHVQEAIPQYLYEHLLARHYGWSLSEIRAMSNYDFQAHLRICMVRESNDNEFKVLLAGGRSGRGRGSSTTHKTFDPSKGDFV